MPPNTSTPLTGERSSQMNDFESLFGVCQASYWAFSAPTSMAVATKTTTAMRRRHARIEHRRALGVRRLPFRIEEVPGARDDATEDGLDFHGPRPIVDLDLSSSAGTPREGRRSEGLLLVARVLVPTAAP